MSNVESGVPGGNASVVAAPILTLAGLWLRPKLAFNMTWLAFSTLLTTATIFGHAQLKEILREEGYFKSVCPEGDGSSSSSGENYPCDEQDQLINDMFFWAATFVNLLGILHGIMAKIYGRRTWTIVCGACWLLGFGLPFYFSKSYSVLLIGYIVAGVGGAGHILTFLNFCTDFTHEKDQDIVQALFFTMHDLSGLVFWMFRRIHKDANASNSQMQLIYLLFGGFAFVNSVFFAKFVTPSKEETPVEIRAINEGGDDAEESQSLLSPRRKGVMGEFDEILTTLRALWQKPLFRAVLFAMAALVLQMYFYMAAFREQMKLATQNNDDAVDELIEVFGLAVSIWGAISTVIFNTVMLTYLSPPGWIISIFVTNIIWVVFTNAGVYFHYAWQYPSFFLFIWWRMFVFQAIAKLLRVLFKDKGLLFSLALTAGGIGQAPGGGLDKLVIFELNQSWRRVFNLILFGLAAVATCHLIWLLLGRRESRQK